MFRTRQMAVLTLVLGALIVASSPTKAAFNAARFSSVHLPSAGDTFLSNGTAGGLVSIQKPIGPNPSPPCYPTDGPASFSFKCINPAGSGEFNETISIHMMFYKPSGVYNSYLTSSGSPRIGPPLHGGEFPVDSPYIFSLGIDHYDTDHGSVSLSAARITAVDLDDGITTRSGFAVTYDANIHLNGVEPTLNVFFLAHLTNEFDGTEAIFTPAEPLSTPEPSSLLMALLAAPAFLAAGHRRLTARAA